MNVEIEANRPMTHEHYALCPICGSNRLKDKFVVKGFTITHCRDCDLIFVKERLSQDDLTPYYDAVDEEYIYNDPVNVENLKYYFRKIKPMIEARVGIGRVLDVGCSAGVFLDVMEGWERHGIEFPSIAGRAAQAQFGDNIHLGTLDDYDREGRRDYFDCITLFDSFDHMLDPLDVLDKCRAMLRPGGLLVIKVHDTGCLYAKLSGASLYSIIPPYHMFFYTRRSLLNALDKMNLKVVEARHLAQVILLKTIPYRLSRNDENSISFRIFRMLEKTRIGQFKVKKNLHDLVTVLAVKPE